MLAGLLLSNMSLGAVTTFGGVNATICLGGLLSAAGGNELRSSICWLLPSDAEAAATSSLPQLAGLSVSCCCWFVCCSSKERAVQGSLKELLPACCC
jgi:hypothetical protein